MQRHLNWAAMLLLLALSAACRRPTDASLSPVFEANGTWILHVGGPVIGDQVFAFNIESASVQLPLESRITARSTSLWDGSRESGLDLTTATAALDPHTGLYRILDARFKGDPLEIDFRISGDSAFGTTYWGVNGRASSGSMVGFRFDERLLRPVAVSGLRSRGDSVPLVLIRLDDAVSTDRDFSARMMARGLVGEVAVPTQWVGTSGHLSWAEVGQLQERGFAVVAHSRYHSSKTSRDIDFMAEVLGSMAELRARGDTTSVFVMPGVWLDSLYFDRPRLQTWRGSFLRSVTSDFEAYAYPGELPLPVGDSVRLGMSHITISDNFSKTATLAAWRTAMQPHHFTEFLVHSYRLPSPDALDFFLDSVAAATTQARVRVLAKSSDLFISAP